MKFAVAALLALSSTAFAQTPGFNVLTKPTQGEEVPAGSTYEIEWQPNAEYPGAITISLLGGATPGTLVPLDDIATGVDGSTGSYSWEVDESLGEFATYGIMITLESDASVFQYSFPFKIAGGDGGDSSTTTTGTGTATATEISTGSFETTTTTTAGNQTSTDITSTSASSTITSTIRGNLSTTATGGAQTTITSLVTQPRPTPTTTSTTSVVTNGVASLAAGSFAMLGGVAMAVLAL